MRVDALAGYVQYIQHLQGMIAKTQDELLLMQDKIGSKRADLTKAMQERKTLENIKEKQYSERM